MSAKRLHNLGAAGAGDVGAVNGAQTLGPCPSCDAELHVAYIENPHTGHAERALMHPVSFCTYYGETDPVDIEHAVARSAEEN